MQWSQEVEEHNNNVYTLGIQSYLLRRTSPNLHHSVEHITSLGSLGVLKVHLGIVWVYDLFIRFRKATGPECIIGGLSKA